ASALVTTVIAFVVRFSMAKTAKIQLSKRCGKFMLVTAEAEDICKNELERAEARRKREILEAKKRHIDKMTQAKAKAAADWKALKDRKDAAMAPVDQRYQQ